MENNIIRVKTISEGHKLNNLPKPLHPLISIVDCFELKPYSGAKIVMDFYSISLKRNCDKLGYGQQSYDFDEGVMGFMGPNQVLRGRKPEAKVPDGWILYFHPSLLFNTPLLTKIKNYEFFGYAVNEGLFLSDKEEDIINGLKQNILIELHSNIDKFSQDIIVAHLETMLNYAERFYQRQFITRNKANHQVLQQLEEFLSAHFDNENKGLPTVQEISDFLNVSPSYLSGLLKNLTGQSTQQHIHEKLIEKAKEKLSTTSLSVNEIAFELGFEHSQSFSKLFKAKTNVSPLEFRHSFSR